MIGIPLLPDNNYPEPIRQATRELLLEAARVTPAKTSRIHLRPVVITIGVVGLALAGTGTAVGYQLFGTKPVTQDKSARCYTEISRDFGADFPGTTIGSPASSAGEAGVVRAPLQACASNWQIGILQIGVHRTVPRPEKSSYPVPHLVGCVLPNGSAAVFPGPEGTCQALGLPAAAPG